MLNAMLIVATTLFVASGFVVGLRILWLARETRGLPELCFGAGLFLIVGVGMPVQLIARVGVLDDPTDTLSRFLMALSGVLMNAGWAAIWIFTWRVFRPTSMAARAAVVVALLTLSALAVVNLVGVFQAGEAGGVDVLTRTLITVFLAQFLYVWTGVESFRYWQLMNRRVSLGLADPVVANRFMLWAIVSGFSFLSLLAPLGFALAGLDYQQSVEGRIFTAIAGTSCAASLWLAFNPPARYVDWVRRTSAVAAE